MKTVPDYGRNSSSRSMLAQFLVGFQFHQKEATTRTSPTGDADADRSVTGRGIGMSLSSRKLTTGAAAATPTSPGNRCMYGPAHSACYPPARLRLLDGCTPLLHGHPLTFALNEEDGHCYRFASIATSTALSSLIITDLCVTERGFRNQSAGRSLPLVAQCLARAP
jgi:hypothetical protein